MTNYGWAKQADIGCAAGWCCYCCQLINYVALTILGCPLPVAVASWPYKQHGWLRGLWPNLPHSENPHHFLRLPSTDKRFAAIRSNRMWQRWEWRCRWGNCCCHYSIAVAVAAANCCCQLLLLLPKLGESLPPRKVNFNSRLMHRFCFPRRPTLPKLLLLPKKGIRGQVEALGLGSSEKGH